MTDLARVAPTQNVADALRAQYGAKASPAELEVFAAAARHLQLSIPAGEIALVPYGNVNTIQITLEGRRTIAQRTGRLKGISAIEWCGPRLYDNKHNKLPLDWEEVWTGDGVPYAARCFVAVDGWDRPANGTCKWAEFNQPNSPVWKKYQSHMLGNAAEKLALRRGFSAEIGKALADLADITGAYHLADDDTGEIIADDGDGPGVGVPGEVPAAPEPPIDPADRSYLADRLAWLADHRPDVHAWLRNVWKAAGRPGLAAPELAAADGRLMRTLLQYPGPAPAGIPPPGPGAASALPREAPAGPGPEPGRYDYDEDDGVPFDDDPGEAAAPPARSETRKEDHGNIQ